MSGIPRLQELDDEGGKSKEPSQDILSRCERMIAVPIYPKSRDSVLFQVEEKKGISDTRTGGLVCGTVGSNGLCAAVPPKTGRQVSGCVCTVL